MVIDPNGSLAPNLARILEWPDQFFLFGVDADTGPSILRKLLALPPHVTELAVPLRAKRARETFAIGVEAVMQLPEQTSDRVRTDSQVQLGQFPADGSQVFARPQTSAAHRIARGILLQQGAESIQDFGRFFSTARRPAPL